MQTVARWASTQFWPSRLQCSGFAFGWLCLFFVGCQTTTEIETSLPVDVSPVTEGDWYRPAVRSSWQWQLLGTLNTSYVVEMYDIDLFDTSESDIESLQARGIRVVCYFSAGSYENWRNDVSDLPSSVLGNTLDGWEDERWLDIRAESVHQLVKKRLNLAVTKGCDGVEPDNVDGYQNNSGFALSDIDQLAFNRFLANEAHLRNLSIGLKNDLDQVAELVAYFDFAVNEQCFEYEECNVLATFIEAGKPVFNAEYRTEWVTDDNERAQVCSKAIDLQLSTLILPLDLDDQFRFVCE